MMGDSNLNTSRTVSLLVTYTELYRQVIEPPWGLEPDQTALFQNQLSLDSLSP